MNCRDVFFEVIYNAFGNKNIIVMIADSSAPCFDGFRKYDKDRFINVGIAEQNLLSVSSGLALTGKKVFLYALNPFPVTRAFDQLRDLVSEFKIPLILTLFNSGTSSALCGYTHMPLENFAMLRTLQNINIIIPSDNSISRKAARICLENNQATIIQFEKFIDSEIYEEKKIDFSKGFLVTGERKDIMVISNGYNAKLIHSLIPKLERHNIFITLIDCFSFPINEKDLLKYLKDSKIVLTFEDNVLQGGLGSYILEILSDNNLMTRVIRYGIKIDTKRSIIESRDSLYKKNLLDTDSILSTISAVGKLYG